MGSLLLRDMPGLDASENSSDPVRCAVNAGGEKLPKIIPIKTFVISEAFGRLNMAPRSKGMQKELPLKHLISFDKYLRNFDRLSENGNEFEKEKARRILKMVEPYPELRQGFTAPRLCSIRLHVRQEDHGNQSTEPHHCCSPRKGRC